jgi:hypothetical protein
VGKDTLPTVILNGYNYRYRYLLLFLAGYTEVLINDIDSEKAYSMTCSVNTGMDVL